MFVPLFNYFFSIIKFFKRTQVIFPFLKTMKDQLQV
jgi:hypothetical protein